MLTPLSRERHTHQAWRRWTSYGFAAQRALVPLVAAEFPKAAMSFPLAFIREGESYLPVAVLGVEPEVNLFVAPDGRWLGGYVPVVLRTYPFSLAQAGEGQWVLCIDEDSGLLSAPGEGEPFFAANGELAEGVKAVLGVLQQVEQNRQATLHACAALARCDLIRPWPIRLRIGESDHQLQGLYQIDEAALNRLADEAFLELRRAGALPLAYCQLLSTQHLGLLGQLAAQRAQAIKPPFRLEEPDLIQFDWDALRKGDEGQGEGPA